MYHETLDDVRGIVHVKDLLRALSENGGDTPVLQVAKSATFAPESMRITDLLTFLQKEQSQLAVIVDEYGGTAGLVTVEDIVEEVVGEIHDEYDIEAQGIQRLPDGSYIVEARSPVDEVNEALDVEIPEREEYESVGGYVCYTLGRIPRAGEQIEDESFHITVQTATPRRLQKLQIRKQDAAAQRND